MIRWLRSPNSHGSWRFALACVAAMVLVLVLMLHSADSAGAQTTTTEAPTTTTTAVPTCENPSLTLEQQKLCAIAYDTERQRAEVLTGLVILVALGGAAFVAGLWLKA